MSEDLPNIFDESARQAGQPKKKKKPPPSEEVTPLQKTEKGERDLKIEEMMDRIRAMREELEEKLQIIQDKSSYLPKNLQKILEHPETHDEQHIAKLVEAQEELEKKVGAILGTPIGSVRERKDDKKEKKRGMKGAKQRARKNWLRME